MISRRRLLLTGVGLATAPLIAACGSSEPTTAPRANLPDYTGQGQLDSFDGRWAGYGWASYWDINVQDGVFTGTAQGGGLSSWTGTMTGYIRSDHTVEGMVSSGNAGTKYNVGGTWQRLRIFDDEGGDIGLVRLERIT